MVGLSSCLIVYAHPATERYIPIGKSPGISYKYTVMGNIKEVDSKKKIITMMSETTRYTVSISKQTKIWLDRNKTRQTNLKGSFSALQPGYYVEVKFENPERRKVAAWVKIETK